MAGLTRWVRPPATLAALEVAVAGAGGALLGLSWSGFMARHMLHPACRHSAPAAWKTRQALGFCLSAHLLGTRAPPVPARPGATRVPLKTLAAGAGPRSGCWCRSR